VLIHGFGEGAAPRKPADDQQEGDVSMGVERQSFGGDFKGPRAAALGGGDERAPRRPQEWDLHD